MKFSYLFILLFILHLFFRFYGLENRHLFGFDQVDNAWVAKTMIVDHVFPLNGPVIKQNSGFYLGPLYYYFIGFFYWIFNLDPIASVIAAGVVSILSFFTFYFVIKNIFSKKIALIGLFIQAISLSVITQDRIQWNANFIAPVSLLIFYSLYKILQGKFKFFFLFSSLLGISFHVHFTSIFYIIIFLALLPFYPRNRDTIKYAALSTPFFLIWLVPSLFAQFKNQGAFFANILTYFGSYYHGFHLQRFLQVAPDAFIQFESILFFPFLKRIGFFIILIFGFLYLKKDRSKKRLLLCYLIGLWFLVPWIVFTTYSGEISNYYFLLTAPFVIVILSYLVSYVFSLQNYLPKAILILFLLFYIYGNVSKFFEPFYRPLSYHKIQVKEAIKKGKVFGFSQYAPQAYLYYLYKRNGVR